MHFSIVFLSSKMQGIEKNLNAVLERIQNEAARVGRRSSEIALVAVSKGRSLEEMRQLYDLGVRDFGENRVAEALGKMERLPKDIRWHLIGKLQKNKVSKVIGRFALIHSVDTPELAKKIAQQSLSAGVQTSILLEVNTSGESTKGGLSLEEWQNCYPDVLSYQGIEINGLMTMAPLTEDEGVIRHCFSELRHLSQKLQEIGGDLTTLSMGMSHDYPIAIQEGATLVRVGTALFLPMEV